MDKVTIKIPKQLYNKIKVLIEDSGFSSPTEFIVYILRDLVSEESAIRQAGKPTISEQTEIAKTDSQELTADEIAAIKKRLKNLGYL